LLWLVPFPRNSFDRNCPAIGMLSLCLMGIKTNLIYSSVPSFATPSEMRARLIHLTLSLHFPSFCGRKAESLTILK
jgi:hypothetical protein